MDGVYSTREAANYLKLAPRTLERYRVSGDGPRYAKLLGAVRYRKRDLDDWIESRIVGSTSEAAA